MAFRAGLALLGVMAGCGGKPYYVDFPDKMLPAPETAELERRLAALRDGSESWHRDPKQVAHLALLHHYEIPWRGDPYRARDYKFYDGNKSHPEWGSYVVRGWVDQSGRAHRYRVKVRRYDEVWYPVQCSRYISVELEDSRFDPGGEPPNVTK